MVTLIGCVARDTPSFVHEITFSVCEAARKPFQLAKLFKLSLRLVCLWTEIVLCHLVSNSLI